MVRAVCFDLDGTLFDDRQYVRAGLLHAATTLENEMGVDLSEELLETYFERGIRDKTFDVVLEEAGISHDIVPDLVGAYHDHDADLDPFPGTIETLETLAEDYRLGLITGGRNGRDKLRRLGIEEYFETVIVTAERDDTKAVPAPFEDALEALETPPERAVYVGDRPQLDFVQPNWLGMYTIRIMTGQYTTIKENGDARSDTTIRTIQELPEAIAKLE